MIIPPSYENEVKWVVVVVVGGGGGSTITGITK